MLEKWIVISLIVNAGLLAIDFLLVKLYETFNITIILKSSASIGIGCAGLYWVYIFAPSEIDLLINSIAILTWLILRLLFSKQLKPNLNEKEPFLNK